MSTTPVAELSGEAAETGTQFLAGGGPSYADARRMRLRRGRLMGFVVCVPLWVLSVVPLAREIIDGREGAAVVLAYLGVVGVSLGTAAVLRVLYVALTKRRFSSPWIFVIAGVLAISGYAVQSAGEKDVPLASAGAGESVRVAPPADL